MKKHATAWAKGLLLYGVGFGLLAYILVQNWQPKGNNPGLKGLLEQTPDVLAFAAVIVLVVGTSMAMYVRWYFLVRALDLPFTVRNAIRLGLVGTFYNAFLPGSVGGDLIKAYFIAKDTPERRAAAVSTVIADRLLGLFGFIWFIAAFGGAFWLSGDARFAGNDYLQGVIRVCTAVVVGVLVVWLLMGFLPQRRADRFKGRLEAIPKLGKTLGEVWFAVWTYRQRPWTVLALIGLTAINHVAMVLLVYLAVRVYPAPEPASLPETFVLAPVGLTAQAFFPAPGGVGGAEAIFGYLYTLLGRPESTGVIGRLTMRVGEWGFGFVGYLVFLRMRKELPAAVAEAQEQGYGGADEPPSAGGEKAA